MSRFLNYVATYFKNIATELNGICLVIVATKVSSVATFLLCLAILILEWYVAT